MSKELTSVLFNVPIIREDKVSVSPNSMRDSLIPTVPVTTLNQPSNSEPSSKLMKYDMEVKSVGCSLDDVINSVASGALGDSDRKRAALEKLSRQAQQATCSICTRTFSNRTQYLNHMETEHYCGPRNYAYGGGRTSNVFYKQDKYTTKSGKPAGYPCPVTGCTQSYVYQNGLYRHLNSVHVMETYDIGEIAGIFSTVWPSKPSLKAVQMMVEDRGIIAAASEIAGL